MALKMVLQPIKIGAVEIPNRVARTAHATGYGLPHATMNDDLIEYHVERAKGGVGLTIIESLMVHPSSPGTLSIGAPGLVEGYRKLVERVRPYGMKLIQQLNHTGNVYPPYDGSPPWSSTDAAGPYAGIRATPMTVAQIRELTAAFVSAAEDAKRGGIDGVEVHCAHGYLLNSYLSALHNTRSDDYGGSFENRLRIVREILEGIRAATGPDFALGVRLSSEILPGGMGPDQVIEVAKKLIELGLMDYLNLSVGTEFATHRIIGGMHEPSGYELPFDVPVKMAVNVPVLVTGRFRTLAEADEVIRSGGADIVALTRAHIADPAIVRKTIENRENEIRPCLGCNHGCIAGLLTVGRIGCTVNPAVGSELRLSEDLIQKSAQPLRVLVIGGGPAGMEAARVAALSGHEVILAEADSRLGGCVNIAKRAPRRIGLGDITDWLEHEIYRLGVDVRLGTYVESTDVAEIAPDVVIVATGSLPDLDGDQSLVPGEMARGMHLPHVISSHQLLLDQTNRNWGTSALVFDDSGHYEAIAAAEFLIEKGLAVTFVTGHISIAPKLEASLAVHPALERMAKGKFAAVTRAKLIEVRERISQIQPRYGGDPIEVAADTVVFVPNNKSNRQVADELTSFSGRVVVVGDALSPRFLQTAIREGHLAARNLNSVKASAGVG